MVGGVRKATEPVDPVCVILNAVNVCVFSLAGPVLKFVVNPVTVCKPAPCAMTGGLPTNVKVGASFTGLTSIATVSLSTKGDPTPKLPRSLVVIVRLAG